MFCSTVIPTVGRATLSRAVESVLGQAVGGDELEVIVVNDSGQPLPPADWQRSHRVRVIETRRRERSVARNTGAAIARGRYLHFLDDDDWLAPDAFSRLWPVARTGQAQWIYGHSQLVSRKGECILHLRHTLNGNCFVQAMAGEWIPLQASMLEADAFFAIGGFDPLIAGPEDIDMLRRFSLRGTLACAPALVAHIAWGAEASTTDYATHAEQSRWAREKILDQPGTWARMRASATSSYWQGRIVRAYGTSLTWNLRRTRMLTAASRTTLGLASLVLAGPSVLVPSFWRALTRPHSSDAFAAGLRDAHRSS
jgi:glycosyltransferase involved in cell wall biosynthesis